MYVWDFFILFVLKNGIIAKNIIKFITMTSHLGFEWQIPNAIVLTVMFTLLSHTHRRSDTDVQKLSQNRYETVSISILKNSHRAELTILHFVKNRLVGTIRIIYLYWKLRNLISFVDLNTVKYFR